MGNLLSSCCGKAASEESPSHEVEYTDLQEDSPSHAAEYTDLQEDSPSHDAEYTDLQEEICKVAKKRATGSHDVAVPMKKRGLSDYPEDTTQLVYNLGEFLCRRCTKIRDLSPGDIEFWLLEVDMWLTEKRWQHVSFLHEAANVVFLYMVCREIISPDIQTERELEDVFLACTYLSYSYIGSEISYPLRPFLVDKADKSAFWEWVLSAVNLMSEKMLRINQDQDFYNEMLCDLLTEEWQQGQPKSEDSPSDETGRIDLQENCTEAMKRSWPMTPGMQDVAVPIKKDIRKYSVDHMELIDNLAEFICRRCVNITYLLASDITFWLLEVDMRLTEEGWQDVSFLHETANVVFLYMVCRELISPDIETEKDLEAIFKTCTYLSYSNIGSKISYPLSPFLVDKGNKSAFWERALSAGTLMSEKMLRINVDQDFYNEMLCDLLTEEWQQ